MKSSTISFVLALAISVAVLAANSASAGGFNFGGGHGGGNGGGHGGMKFSGGNSNHNKMHHNNHHDHHNHGHHHHKHHHHDYWYHKQYHRPYVNYYYTQPAPVIVTAPTCNISLAADEPARTQIPIGSVLVLDGQPLGSAKGTVRLIVNNLAMPVEVLEWTATSAKIRVPMFELAGPMTADLEVLRADGSLASKSLVELTLAVPQVAAIRN